VRSDRSRGRERRLATLVLLPLVVLSLTACGGGTVRVGDHAPSTITVLAASSLSKVFPRIAARFSAVSPSRAVRFSFAGTDSLVTQIEQGAPADAFAGASKKYGDQLATEGLVQTPQPFATNALVAIVPASNPVGISRLEDLAKPGVKLVIGAETVPIGSYTRTVLTNLDASLGSSFSEKVLANVVSNEDNVEGVLSKVRLGEADAGFVYVTDAKAAGADVRTVALPEAAQAVAVYPIAVVTKSPHAVLAEAFVRFVLSTEGQHLLRGAGFGPPAAS
jgi:molybdate transport system substrate-binding protein